MLASEHSESLLWEAATTVTGRRPMDRPRIESRPIFGGGPLGLMLVTGLLVLGVSCGTEPGNRAAPISFDQPGSSGGVAASSSGGASGSSGAGTATSSGGTETGTAGNATLDPAAPDDAGNLPTTIPVEIEVPAHQPGIISGDDVPTQVGSSGGGASSGGASGGGNNSGTEHPGAKATIIGLDDEPAGTTGAVVAKAGPLETKLTFETAVRHAKSVRLIVRTPTISADHAVVTGHVVARDLIGSGRVKAGTLVQVSATVSGQDPVAVEVQVDAFGHAAFALTVPGAWFKVGAVVNASLRARLVVDPAAQSQAHGVNLLALVKHAASPLTGVDLVLPAAEQGPGATFAVPVYAHTMVNPLDSVDVDLQYDNTKLEVANVTLSALLEGEVKQSAASVRLVAKRGAGVGIGQVSGKVLIATVTFKVKLSLTIQIGAKAWIKGVTHKLHTLQNVPLVGPGTAAVVHDGAGSGATGHVHLAADEVRGLFAWADRHVIYNTAQLTGVAVRVKVHTRAVWRFAGVKDCAAQLESEDTNVLPTDGTAGVKLTGDEKGGGESAGAEKHQVLVKFKGEVTVVLFRIWFVTQVSIQTSDKVLNAIE